MGESTKTILRDLGVVIHIPGIMALVSLLVALWYGEIFAVLPLLVTAAVAIGAGQLLYRVFRAAARTRLPHAMVLAALAWVVVPLIGTIPFLLISDHFAAVPDAPQTILLFGDFWNALFEAFSGFTSTGLTMTLDPSELPRALQWWRSFMEWIGGIGVIVLMLIILDPSSDAYRLYRSEGREEKILPNLRNSVRAMGKIYLLYTAAGILLLRLLGMPWWEALNHGLTGISTGGFSTTANSMAGYSPAIQLAMILLMLFGAISFATHYRLLYERRWLEAWRALQPRVLLFLLLTGGVLLLLENVWYQGEWLPLDSAFQWVSALGTAGFSTADIARWSPAAHLLLTLAMIIGGAGGSTAGGIKLNRVAVIYKGLIWRFKRIYSKPHELVRYEIDGEVLSEEQIGRRLEAAGILIALWALTLLLGVLVLLHVLPDQLDLHLIIFEANSALSSVGLSVGLTTPDLRWPAKLAYILLMWMGRLEIIPVFILFSWPLGRLRDTLQRQLSSVTG
jgi:trk system potassium uptake protein TrkH